MMDDEDLKCEKCGGFRETGMYCRSRTCVSALHNDLVAMGDNAERFRASMYALETIIGKMRTVLEIIAGYPMNNLPPYDIGALARSVLPGGNDR